MTIIVTMNYHDNKSDNYHDNHYYHDYHDNQCDNYHDNHYYHDHQCDIDLLQFSVWRRLLALVTDLILSIFHSILSFKNSQYYPSSICWICG